MDIQGRIGIPICPQTVSWREIRDGVEAGEFGWKDLVDFYGRHSCDEYTFFNAYRFRASATETLPAKAEEEI